MYRKLLILAQAAAAAKRATPSSTGVTLGEAGPSSAGTADCARSSSASLGTGADGTLPVAIAPGISGTRFKSLPNASTGPYGDIHTGNVRKQSVGTDRISKANTSTRSVQVEKESTSIGGVAVVAGSKSFDVCEEASRAFSVKVEPHHPAGPSSTTDYAIRCSNCDRHHQLRTNNSQCASNPPLPNGNTFGVRRASAAEKHDLKLKKITKSRKGNSVDKHEESEEAKRAFRSERNRRSAAASRFRKKVREQHLKDLILHLTVQIRQKEQEHNIILKQLEDEKLMLDQENAALQFYLGCVHLGERRGSEDRTAMSDL